MLFDELEEKEYFTVAEINGEIRALLEENYDDIAVIGEVSNFKRHSSGHLYFTLKDADAQLRTVCFRREARELAFDPEDGLQVIARGRLTLYESYGQYQLVAHSIEQAGVGRLEIAFRKLKDKLEAEGLFDPAHKKPLPAYPFDIGVVTSPTGAAVRDIVSTLQRRWPCATVWIYPVRVQGDLAATEIARALARLPQLDALDIVIVGRGGGSLEDLWAFNEEIVARAIYDCPIPVISAVGHETDFTIADFVADLRAATPTMAAEVAVPRMDEVTMWIDERMNRLVRHTRLRLDRHAGRLQELLRSYALGRVRGQIERHLQSHDYAMERLHGRVVEAIRRRRIRLAELMVKLEALDVRSVMSRGFAICSDTRTGSVITSAPLARRAGAMNVAFKDGTVLTKVEKEEQHDGRQDEFRGFDEETRANS